ncbi:site-specific integrase [Enterococcus faecalis]|nr:site-specific integrase [Enterococcus faecalis]
MSNNRNEDRYKQYTDKRDGNKYWKFSAYLGINPDTGKEKRTTRSRFKTKAEAKLAYNRLMTDFKDGKIKSNKKQVPTFNELYEEWLAHHRLEVRASTVATNRRFIEKHVLPVLGKYKIDKITVSQCQEIVNMWQKDYKQSKYFRRVTAQVLQYAVRMQYIQNNCMKNTIPPKNISTKKTNFYTKEQLETFFECLNHHVMNNGRTGLKLLAFFRVLAFTGLRKSEVLSLQWKDINIKEATANIYKTLAVDEYGKIIIQSTKTVTSTRKVKLDEKTLEILSEWQENQVEWYAKYGINTSDKNQFIFTNKKNELYYPQAVNDWLYMILNKYNLPQITIHGFRHTFASLLFKSGLHPKTAQELLGHKNIETTMNIYTHVTESDLKNAHDQFANYVDF